MCVCVGVWVWVLYICSPTCVDGYVCVYVCVFHQKLFLIVYESMNVWITNWSVTLFKSAFLEEFLFLKIFFSWRFSFLSTVFGLFFYFVCLLFESGNLAWSRENFIWFWEDWIFSVQPLYNLRFKMEKLIKDERILVLFVFLMLELFFFSFSNFFQSFIQEKRDCLSFRFNHLVIKRDSIFFSFVVTEFGKKLKHVNPEISLKTLNVLQLFVPLYFLA